MLKTKKTKTNMDTIEDDLSYVIHVVDELYKKVDSGFVTHEEFRLVKLFTYIIVGVLCIFELISVYLILTQ